MELWNITQAKNAKDWRKIIRSKEFEDCYTYSNDDLGAVYTKDETTFKVWAPTASLVKLNLYATGSDQEAGSLKIGSKPMERLEKGVWSCSVTGDWNGTYYTYLITADGQTHETGDVYAKACGVNGDRSMVVDLTTTNPINWDLDQHVTYPLEETVIWEVHIGDFSNDKNSWVRPDYRGKYMAFTEQDTTLKGDGIHKTCLNYLKNIGVTHVHLLPAFDFGSVDERNLTTPSFNWGYDPVNYNVPEGSYATDPFHGEVRIREFKEMVAALHKAGISVVMDVVYNHTHSLDSHFNHTVPYYYYRQQEDGTYSNGSDCGNDTASERVMFRKYMIESILYWINEYHIDGFRFDLMGLHDTQTMNDIRREMNKLDGGSNLILYGEPWAAGDSPMAEGYFPGLKSNLHLLEDGIEIFNDDTRDAIKGSYCYLDEKGYVNGAPDMEDNIKRSILGLLDTSFLSQPKNPSQVIQYISAHDNSTLWDKLVDSVRMNKDYNTIDPELIKMNKLAAALVLTCKGIHFMQAGEEAGRSKAGHDNSYNLTREINQLDWERMYQFEDLMLYYKGLIEIRKQFHGFLDLSEKGVLAIDFIDDLPKQVIAYTIEDRNTKNRKKAIIIFNASKETVTINIPSGNWTLLADGHKAFAKGIRPINDKILVDSLSPCILVL